MIAKQPMQSMAAVSDAAPNARGFHPIRWFGRLSWVGRGFVTVAVLIASTAVFFAFENWRGERAWAAYRAQLVASGVELDRQKFTPAPVLDEQNFAMTPFLAPLFDMNPQPREPSQPVWRDMAGHDRAANFAANILQPDKKGAIPATGFDGKLTDFAAMLKQLNGPSAPQEFASREKAAAALLETIEPYRAVLDELRAASARPYSRFNIEYDAPDPMAILLPHYRVLERVVKLLQTRAAAELALGQSGAAFDDVKLMLFVANSIAAEPMILSSRVRAYMLSDACQGIWEGLATRRWTDAQLRQMQASLAEVSLVAGLGNAMVAERATYSGEILRFAHGNKNQLRSIIAGGREMQPLTYLLAGPGGWFYEEEISYQRLFAKYELPSLDVQHDRFHPGVIKANGIALTNELSGLSLWRHNGFSKLILPADFSFLRKVAIAETRLRLTVLACAIERYRLTRGELPQTLDALVSAYIAAVPADPCDGKPMKYRAEAVGGFVLYGVGWNETDDHGTVVMSREGTEPDFDEGDWVWPQYPAS
jgi:hypothetical protein